MRRSHVRLMAGGAVLGLAVAACGGSSSGGGGGGSSTGGGSVPGVTSTTVTIGSTQPLTGIAAAGYSEIAPASKAYFDYINSQGGINGRTIVYKYLDDAYNPQQTLAQTRKLILQDKVFAIFNALGTPTHLKVVDFLNQQKVPDLFVASGCLCWDNVSQHPETFGWQTDYAREGKILGAYVKSHFAGKRIAYFYQNDDFGQDGVKGLDKEIPKSQVVARVPYEVTNLTGVGTPIQKLLSARPDLIVSFSVPAFTAALRLGMVKAGATSTKLAVSNVGADPITLTTLLKVFAAQAKAGNVNGNQLIEGIISDAYESALGDTSNSWIKLFKKIHDQYIPKLPFDGNVEYGMAAAYTFAEALKGAGQNPTRDSLVKAVENGLAQGPGLVPFAFSASSHAGFEGTQVGIIHNGFLQLVGKPETTDDGSGPVKPFTGTQPTAPANGIPS